MSIDLSQEKKENYMQGSRQMAVVIIDEIGLAENSPHNPLKVLHKPLEHPKTSIVGISNWSVDAAKMNRALFISRL
jgi:hypothetical protein